MSTAMTLGVSAFYDVGDILYQQDRKNQRNMQLTERRILGMGTAASSGSSCRGPCSRSLSVTDAFAQQAQHFLQQNQNTGSPVLGRDCNSPPSMNNTINSLTMNNSNTMNLGSQTRRLDRSVSEPAGDRNGVKNNVNTSRYKTELCRPFEESGHCKYGDKCQFAHGMDELRSLSRHPKYKTELCRTFHTIGFCPYGPRCHFVHNEDLRRFNAMNQFKLNDLTQFQQAQQQLQQQQQQQQQQQNALKLSPPVGSQHVVSGPTPITRPKALSFSYSSGYVRDSLGSTADSPPSSITDSPTLSPTMHSDDFLSGMGFPSAFSPFSPPPPTSAPPSGVQGAFTFPGEDMLNFQQPPPPMMTPLNIQTDLNQIQAQLTALCLNQRNNNHHMSSMPSTQTPVSSTCSSSSEDFTLPLFPRDSTDITNAPPSPPDSLSGDSGVSSTCEYPLDVSRGLRLPIFSQLSNRE